MRYSKRTVDAITISKLNMIVGWPAVFSVAPVAEVVRSKAMPQGDRAAIHAFPVYLLLSMLLTNFLASPISLHLAAFAS